jgi:hypothetical protein
MPLWLPLAPGRALQELKPAPASHSHIKRGRCAGGGELASRVCPKLRAGLRSSEENRSNVIKTIRL